MANPQGYIIIKRENAQPPPEELFAAVESYIGKAKFQEMRGSIADEVGAQRVNGGDASEALLHHGINFSNIEFEPFFQDVLGCSFDEAKKSKVEVVFWRENKTQLPRYPAGLRGTVHIFCSATIEELHEGNGLFRIVEGSHTMTRGQFRHIEPTPIRLQPNQILILSADLTIQYPQGGGGVGVFMRLFPPT
ncbi:conserved hypothetical protein [Histoplasma capsulatum G186AR]|uniref:Uncharacterized protein n=2 Tax=Ajellomyces capsulatus TaxID=5037 RepID=C0NVS1_AJECG|nr:uncharacterized protein HCBG_07251 [Histoplasma capsulatum G186AR]EEH04610.1 conserved hypothetical protein [Histoplasma capsulatum G186AR]